VALRSLVEDELLLAVPAAPMHPPEECPVKLDELNADPEQSPDVAQEVAGNPFAALAGWKGDKENQD